MSHGTEIINDKQVLWGYFSVRDWLECVMLSFPAPWSLGDDTHYGTEVLDARGKQILRFWETEGQKPSKRELGDSSLEEWNEYCCDNHWESELSLETAEAVITLRNRITGDFGQEEDRKDLVTIIVSKAVWGDSVTREVECGGPKRRLAWPKSGSMRKSVGAPKC